MLKGVKTSKWFLKHDYPKYLHVTCDGKVSHDPYINHCLPFAFGNCNEDHTSECVECNEIFNLFEELRTLLGDEK